MSLCLNRFSLWNDFGLYLSTKMSNWIYFSSTFIYCNTRYMRVIDMFWGFTVFFPNGGEKMSASYRPLTSLLSFNISIGNIGHRTLLDDQCSVSSAQVIDGPEASSLLFSSALYSLHFFCLTLSLSFSLLLCSQLFLSQYCLSSYSLLSRYSRSFFVHY